PAGASEPSPTCSTPSPSVTVTPDPAPRSATPQPANASRSDAQHTTVYVLRAVLMVLLQPWGDSQPQLAKTARAVAAARAPPLRSALPRLRAPAPRRGRRARAPARARGPRAAPGAGLAA